MTISQLQLFSNSNDALCVQELYSVKKRLLLPRWWLKGIFCISQEKSALCAAFLAARSQGLVVGTSIPNLKVFFAVAQFWHNVTKQMLSSEDFAIGSTVRISVNEIFRGTRTDQLSTFEYFRQAVTTPFCIKVARRAQRAAQKSSRIEPSSRASKHSYETLMTTSLLRNLELSSDGFVVAEFLTSIRSVIEGSCFEPVAAASESLLLEEDSDPFVVSLNPSVLKWYGDKTGLKKLALYFFLELEKNRFVHSNPDAVMAGELSMGHATEFFKELFAKAGGLYDHGVLGWNEGAPPGRVSDYVSGYLVKKQGLAGCVQIVSLSEHLRSVVLFERSIDEKFFPERAIYSQIATPSVQPEAFINKTAKAKPTGRSAKLRRFAQKSSLGIHLGNGHELSVSQRNQGAPSFKKRLAETKVRDQEKEYVLQLAQYYESLSPSQRRELDLEMKKRSPSEFHAWLQPILKGLH